MKLYLWLILIVPVGSTRQSTELPSGCFYKYRPYDCVYNVTCVDDTNIFFEQNIDNVCSNYVFYGGNSYLPVHVVYRRQYSDAKDAITWRNSYPAVYGIVEFNLSNNKYQNEPALDTMPNLRLLNISRNSLNAARLSNNMDYPNLVHIDYSYNRIMRLQLVNSEYVYEKLKTLDLSHNALDNIPQAIFVNFSELEHLNLSNNHLMDLDGRSFDGVINLRSLKIDHNDIIDINSALSNLNNLQELSLNNNRIEEILIRDFHNLSQLIELDLSCNDISHIDEHVFDNMNTIRILNLSENNLDNINGKLFSNNNYLDNFDLSMNKLNRLPNELFNGKNLSFFSIEDNRLEGELVQGMFYGLKRTVSVDISGQRLTSIGDYAFVGFDNLEILMLNKNKIKTLAKKSFTSLKNLKQLDLSNNFIAYIDFEMFDLVNLESLSLRSNLITLVKEDDFKQLCRLKIFDMAHNEIKEVENKAFKELRMLEEFKFNSNFTILYSRALFDGEVLSLLHIDISYSKIPVVKNYTFMEMRNLKHINISHCSIGELQFNTFSYTGNVQMIDLSHNKLTNFIVATKDLPVLEILLLNFNHFTVISANSFKNIPQLRELDVSNNLLEEIDNEAFTDNTSLINLDISFNYFSTMNLKFLAALSNLRRINISGVLANIVFGQLKKTQLTELHISQTRLQNATELRLGNLKRLENIFLNNNKITGIDKDAFSEVIRLQYLDLSYNKIRHVQSGVFINNVHLKTLNISHNLLTAFQYGTFRGLIRLNILDLSFNSIGIFENDLLNDIENLASLIVDSNRLLNFDYNGLSKSSLMKLSLGDNPIPCKHISLLRQFVIFEITATRMVEHEENIYGIKCNKQLS